MSDVSDPHMKNRVVMTQRAALYEEPVLGAVTVVEVLGAVIAISPYPSLQEASETGNLA